MASTGGYPPSAASRYGSSHTAPPRPNELYSPKPLRPSAQQASTANSKSLYDLPPSFHPQSIASTGGGRSPSPRVGTAGGLRNNAPSMSSKSPHAHSNSLPSSVSLNGSGAGGGGSSTTSLYHPQPRHAHAVDDASSSRDSARSPPFGGSASVFSKAPQNPSSPSNEQIGLFAHHCHLHFYEQHHPSTLEMNRILSALPPSHRAAFTRVQASIRQAFHRDEAARRRNEFEVLVRGTEPGGGLTIASRRDPRGPSARKERRAKLKAFLTTHAGRNHVGPEPFLVGLYTVLRLQALAAEKGGAGDSRIEWEIDDAVWMEAGGKDFMIEALATIKGILGFSDVPRPKPRRRRRAPPQPPRAASNSFSSTLPFRRAAELEELRSTPEEDAENDEPVSPLVGPLHASRSPTIAPSSGRRGKAPPPPNRRSSASSANPSFANSRRRATSDPFSDPRALRSNAPPLAGSHRRGPAPPPPSPSTRQHNPLSLGLNLNPSNSTSIAPSLASRSYSHASSTNSDIREPITPSEDLLLLPAHHLSSSSSSSPRPLPGTPSSMLSDSAVIIDDEDNEDALSLSSDLSSGSDSSSSDEDDQEADVARARPRVWVTPSNLTNPELLSLTRLFPSHLRRAAPARSTRFPYIGPAQPGALLAPTAGAPSSAVKAARLAARKGALGGASWKGTGSCWRAGGERDRGWKGGVWERVKGWFASVFSSS